MAIIYFPSGNTTKQTGDWVSVNPNSGSGDGSLSVSADTHTGRSARNCGTSSVPSVAVTAGGVSKKFYVSQGAKSEFVSISTSAISAAAAGQTVTIKGYSNSSKLTFSWKSGSALSSAFSTYTGAGSTQTSGTALQADPGAASQYEWSVSVTLPNNKSTSAKSSTLVVTCNGGQTAELSVGQKAGAKSYGTPTISAFAYNGNVGANGTTSATVKTLTYSQTWTWNGVSGSGDTVSSGGTAAYTITSVSGRGAAINATSGAVTCSSLGTTYKANAEKIGTASVTVTLNGKTSEAKTCDVSQAANTITLTCTPSGGAVTSSVSFAAAGENNKSVSNVTAASITVSGKFSSGSSATKDTHYTVSSPTYSWDIVSQSDTTNNPYTLTSSNAASISTVCCSTYGTVVGTRTATARRTASWTVAFKSGYGGSGNGTKTATSSGGALTQTNAFKSAAVTTGNAGDISIIGFGCEGGTCASDNSASATADASTRVTVTYNSNATAVYTPSALTYSFSIQNASSAGVFSVASANATTANVTCASAGAAYSAKQTCTLRRTATWTYKENGTTRTIALNADVSTSRQINFLDSVAIYNNTASAGALTAPATYAASGETKTVSNKTKATDASGVTLVATYLNGATKNVTAASRVYSWSENKSYSSLTSKDASSLSVTMSDRGKAYNGSTRTAKVTRTATYSYTDNGYTESASVSCTTTIKQAAQPYLYLDYGTLDNAKLN